MGMQRGGLLLFGLGVAVTAADIVYGKQIQAEVATLGLAGMQAKYGDNGLLKVLLFAFAFPLGVGVSLLGAALFGGTARSRAGKLGGIALLLVLVPILAPGIFGTQHSPNYFGYGGMSILVLVAAAMWYWGKYRMRLTDAMRPAADWQGLGYLAFALAAWNLCGFGGMPGFAVYPEKMIALSAIPFAVGQLKAVMALFILGWIFTVLGLRRAAQVVR
jgi:hypothetical protein